HAVAGKRDVLGWRSRLGGHCDEGCCLRPGRRGLARPTCSLADIGENEIACKANVIRDLPEKRRLLRAGNGNGSPRAQCASHVLELSAAELISGFHLSAFASAGNTVTEVRHAPFTGADED